MRDFRDKYLISDFRLQIAKFKTEIPNVMARAIAGFYYEISLPIADYISQHESLRTATRWALTPVVYGIKYPIAIVIIFFTPLIVFISYRKLRKD